MRWVPDLGFGYGYALFNFYPPLSYYLGEVFHLAGLGFIDSIKLVWGLALLGSGITMFFLARKYFGTIGGIISGLFYVYTPYHAIDAYVRGALAELFSFVWLPLILLFSNKPIISGIFLALLMVTHNLIFLPFVGFYVLWSRNIKNIFISLSIAFGTTAFFWLPSLYEKQFTLVDDLLLKNLALYKIHFVCLPQLWNSDWGFGGSIPGCIDGMSFRLGKLHILVALAAFILAIIKRSKIHVSIFMLLVLSVFMTTEYSSFIWDRIPQLWYLQFPWRFLEFAALFSSLLAGSLIFFKNKLLNYFMAVGLVALLLFFIAKLFVPQTYTKATDADLTSDAEIKHRVSSTSFEYLPKGLPLNPREYQTIELTPDQLPVINFPGMKVYLNGQETAFRDDNKFKLVTLNFPVAGKNVTAMLENTPVRVAGNLISLMFTVGIGLYLIYGRARNKK